MFKKIINKQQLLEFFGVEVNFKKVIFRFFIREGANRLSEAPLMTPIDILIKSGTVTHTQLWKKECTLHNFPHSSIFVQLLLVLHIKTVLIRNGISSKLIIVDFLLVLNFTYFQLKSTKLIFIRFQSKIDFSWFIL